MDRLYLEHDKQRVDEDDDWTGFLSTSSGNIIFVVKYYLQKQNILVTTVVITGCPCSNRKESKTM